MPADNDTTSRDDAFTRYKRAYADDSPSAAQAQAKAWDTFAADVGRKAALEAYWAWQRTLPQEQRSDVDPYG